MPEGAAFVSVWPAHVRRFLDTLGKGDEMRDRRDIVVSLAGYLLFVAMAVAVIAALMTH